MHFITDSTKNIKHVLMVHIMIIYKENYTILSLSLSIDLSTCSCTYNLKNRTIAV